MNQHRHPSEGSTRGGPSAALEFVHCSFGWSFTSQIDREGSKLWHQSTVLAEGDPAPEEHLKLCEARCFPPAARVWDPPFGLEVLPNLDSEIVVVDLAPAMYGSSYGSGHTTIVLLITGLAVAAVLFTLMRQARAWELELMVPSVMACIEANLRFSFLVLVMAPRPIDIGAEDRDRDVGAVHWDPIERC